MYIVYCILYIIFIIYYIYYILYIHYIIYMLYFTLYIIHSYIHTFIHTHTHHISHTYTHTHTHTHTQTHTHTHTHVHVYMHICACIFPRPQHEWFSRLLNQITTWRMIWALKSETCVTVFFMMFKKEQIPKIEYICARTHTHTIVAHVDNVVFARMCKLLHIWTCIPISTCGRMCSCRGH